MPKKPLVVHFEPAQYAALEREKARSGAALAEIVRRAVEQYLKPVEKKESDNGNG